MKIIESIQYNNDCYQAGRKIDVQGLMLHSVGCPQPDATVFVENWDAPVGVGVHAFVDGITGDVYQTLPWNHRGWHCGDQANNTHIGVEMCEPDNITYYSGANFTCTDPEYARTIVKRTYDSAVELFAMLCVKFDLDPATDIISHNEGALMGIASEHSDPEHLWNGLNTGYTMNGFRQAVMNRIHEGGVSFPSGDTTPPKVTGESYLVVIDATVLNVRSGPSTKYPIQTRVHEGEVYTIVDEEDGWGKLKSGAGWIYLDYTSKL